MNILVDVCKEVTKNVAMSIPVIRDWRLKRPRTSAKFDNSDESLERYALLPLRNLLASLGSVKGMHIIEIGPGDHLASGLSMLAAGAASYTSVDRFPGDYSGAHAKDWYRGVRAAWERKFPDIKWPDYLSADDFPENYMERVKVLAQSIEDANTTQKKYDIICSFHVAEHVSDIAAFAKANAALIGSTGRAVHLVDFGPHNWELYPNKLTFLRFPEWLWNWMGSRRGIPNRYRYHELVAVLERAGLEIETSNMERLEGKINKTKLARRFRNMPMDSVAVMTATLICRLRADISSETDL